MLLVALGGCTGIDAISIMNKKRVDEQLPGQGLRASRRTSTQPYTSIIVEHVVKASSIDDASVARAVELSAQVLRGRRHHHQGRRPSARTRIIDEQRADLQLPRHRPTGQGTGRRERREAVGTSA